MTDLALHTAIWHGRDGRCDCPPGWPMDLSPGGCLPCYAAHGVDRPREQCPDHVAVSEGTRQVAL